MIVNIIGKILISLVQFLELVSHFGKILIQSNFGIKELFGHPKIVP